MYTKHTEYHMKITLIEVKFACLHARQPTPTHACIQLCAGGESVIMCVCEPPPYAHVICGSVCMQSNKGKHENHLEAFSYPH